MPEELWMEVCNCRGGSDQKHSQEKEMQKGIWLPEEALQIAEKSRDTKGKGNKEINSHLNAEFQRIARRDKKAFLSEQCKEIGGNNRMGMTKDLFRRIIDAKGIFHAKVGIVKDRNCMDLTEAEDIKKRRQEELYKKGLNDPNDHDSAVIQLEPDFLECEVKWTSRSITLKKLVKVFIV